jgi:serine/threonine-protein kinase
MTNLRRLLGFIEPRWHKWGAVAFVSAFLIWSPAVRSEESAAEANVKARAARVVLRDHCAECHGGVEPEQGLSILDYDALLEGTYVVAEDVEHSIIWQRINDPDDPMPPPKKGKPLTDAEKQILREWIEGGAPRFPVDEYRKLISEHQVLTSIVNDLQKFQAADRPYIRYFSLLNLYNNSFDKRIGANSKNVDDDELNYARAALSLLLNSLSWKQKVALPAAIDASGITFRVDLRDYDWSDHNWVDLIKSPSAPYPYGVDVRFHQNGELAAIASRHYELRQGDHPASRTIPYVRVDWFINTASRGDLYNRLLKLPENVKSLERQLLEVDSEANFLRHQLHRAGLISSGVSQHNRLVERHETKYGAYWKSYDFSGSEGDRDLLKHPLGPEFPHNPFNQYAFKADGGEMIFNLPNGLQAYYLAGQDGNRITKGPTDIVEDKIGASGSVTVENAISCFACHDQGMKTFTDVVLNNHAFSGIEREAIRRIYPPSKQMDEMVQSDAERFQRAVRMAIEPWFPNGASAEPVSSVAKKYQREIQLEEAAVECGVRNTGAFAARIRQDSDLRREVGPLAEGRGIKRTNWERGVFKKVIREIEAGTPVGL